MPTKEISQNWTRLEPGDNVIVIDPAGNESPGTIDDKTSTSDVVWVVQSTGRDRRAYDHREGVKIRLTQ